MNKNYIYCRVSSDKQANYVAGSTSLEVQQDTVYDYCDNNGITVEHCYFDICSARNMDKLYYQKELLKLCKPGDTIYVYDISRFSRNTLQALKLLEELDKQNIKIFSVKEGCTFNSPFQRNMFRMLLCKAENESDIISSRVKDSIKYRRQRGDYIGNPGFGYKCEKNKAGIRKKVVNKEEMMVIELINKLSDTMKPKQISIKLNSMNLKKRNLKWTPFRVKYLLKKHNSLLGMSSLKKSLDLSNKKKQQKKKNKIHKMKI